MSGHLDEHELDALLRETDHVDDNGFTERVTAVLPPPRRRRSGMWAIGACTALAVAVGLLVPPVREVFALALVGVGAESTGAAWAPVVAVALVCLGSLWGVLEER